MNASELKSSFDERGYVGPVRLFSRRECLSILARLHEDQAPPLDWDKGRATTSVAYYTLATDDRILDLVTSVLGADVLLWGASLLVRRPGAEHRWHTDVESALPTGETVAVWVGLTGTDVRTSLKIVPFSHRFGVTLQQVVHDNGGTDFGDEEIGRWAQQRDSSSGVDRIDMVDGDAVIFDGRLWHGSHNLSDETREAVLLQYATPRTSIRMPNPERFTWPFGFYEVPKPPCIVVSGRDSAARNRLVPGPTAMNSRVLPAVSSRIHSLRLPLAQDPDVGWKPHPLFRGSTAEIKEMGCHVSVLDPDREPHPPHRHDEEELLVVLDGEPTLVLDDPASTHRVQRGTFSFYPAGFAHTIRNTSDAPATYVMFKWTTDRKDEGDFLNHRVVSFRESRDEIWEDDSNGVAMWPVLDGETNYLRHLHAHVTRLEPGAGYDTHVDAYDVGLVVLEGEVETLGERVGPNGVVFYAAGEPHGMRNVGQVPAVYLVFEFRGRHSGIGEAEEPPLPRRLIGAIRHPRAAARALRSRLG